MNLWKDQKLTIHAMVTYRLCLDFKVSTLIINDFWLLTYEIMYVAKTTRINLKIISLIMNRDV